MICAARLVLALALLDGPPASRAQPPDAVSARPPMARSATLEALRDSLQQAGPAGGLQDSTEAGQLFGESRRSNAGLVLPASGDSDSPTQRLGGTASTEALDRQSRDPRDELEKMLRQGYPAVIRDLSDELLSAATLHEKLLMLQMILDHGEDYGADGGSIPSNKDIRWPAIKRILASAPDAGSFDYLYYRVNHTALQRDAWKGYPEGTSVEAMISSHHSSAKPGDWQGYLDYIDAVADATRSQGNKVEFLVDGVNLVPKFLDAIENARKFIHIEVFQLQSDDMAGRFIQKLIAKAKQGVRVRMIVDEQGTINAAPNEGSIKRLLNYIRDNGIEVAVRPAPLTVDHVTHRKIYVFDGKVGFMGGMNIGQDYQKEWHDQLTRIEGPVIYKLHQVFLRQWKNLGRIIPTDELNDLHPDVDEFPDGVDVRIIAHDGGEKDHNIKAAYLRAFATAEHGIRIANPYFADSEVLDALRRAAFSGVRVQLVFPRENDEPLLRRAARAVYPALIEAGAEIYEYEGRMAHEKVATIDGIWSTFGSSNLDSRSLNSNDEINAVSIDPRVAQDIDRKLFDVDIPKSERITHHDLSFAEWIAWQLRGLL